MNDLKNYRWFQWIAGEEKGQIKIFDKIESDGADVFIVFKDGSRVNESFVAPLNQIDLTGKFMSEIDNPKNGWTFKEEIVGRVEEKWAQNADGIEVCVEPGVPGKVVIKLIPPNPTPKTHSSFGIIANSQAPVYQEEVDEKPKEVPKPMFENDPVYILMSKSKKEESEIIMSMTISLPPKSLYDISKQSFDEGDQKFIEYIIENISINEIKDALKVAIKDMYENNEEFAI